MIVGCGLIDGDGNERESGGRLVGCRWEQMGV